jgi:hypothetical protein
MWRRSMFQAALGRLAEVVMMQSADHRLGKDSTALGRLNFPSAAAGHVRRPSNNHESNKSAQIRKDSRDSTDSWFNGFAAAQPGSPPLPPATSGAAVPAITSSGWMAVTSE